MTEKHELLAELAQINIEIMQAKDALLSAHAEKEAFLAARDEEAVKRVADVLKASKEALDTASSHLRELERIRQGVGNVVCELLQLKEALAASRESLKEEETRTYAEIDEKTRELNAFMASAKAEQLKIESAWSQIGMKEQTLGREAARVRDERLQLSAAKKYYGKRTT